MRCNISLILCAIVEHMAVIDNEGESQVRSCRWIESAEAQMLMLGLADWRSQRTNSGCLTPRVIDKCKSTSRNRPY